MRMSKSVSNGSKGEGVFQTLVGVSAHASKGIGTGKSDGSLNISERGGRTPGAVLKGPGGPSAPDVEQKFPNPEVKERRRRLTREYKIGILKELDKLKGKPGAIGECLRREGLYSATVAYWRKQRNEGALGKTRGRKPTDPLLIENKVLEKKIGKLETKLKQYVLVIEAQKKMSEILGIRQDNVPPMPEDDED